jgi:hypothetical protein
VQSLPPLETDEDGAIILGLEIEEDVPTEDEPITQVGDKSKT